MPYPQQMRQEGRILPSPVALQNPFEDPDTNQPLQRPPPSRPGTPQARAPARPPSPFPVLSESKNPFADPLSSSEPTAPQHVSKSELALWSNNPYHGSPSTPTPALKPSSKQSIKDAAPSFVNNTRLGPSTPPFAPSYPSGFDVNKLYTSTTTHTPLTRTQSFTSNYSVPKNPFADPSPSSSPSPYATQFVPSSPAALRPSRLSPTDVNSSAQNISRTLEDIDQNSPPTGQVRDGSRALSPVSLNRFNSVSIAGSKYDLSKEVKLREAAKHQDYRLEVERQKSRDGLHATTPQLLPSPRLGLLPRGQYSGSSVTLMDRISRPRVSVIKNSVFWVFFAMIQVGLISAGAAFAVLLRDKGVGENVSIGTGMVFWLVISVICAIIGAVGSLCIWGLNGGHCTGTLRKAGLDEMGLLGSDKRNPTLVGAGIREREAREEFELERIEWIRQRQRDRERVRLEAREGSMVSVRTQDGSGDEAVSSHTEIHTVSPLENLARELNTPELRMLPEGERQTYLQERRARNAEKGRRVRQSLDRQNTMERKPTITRRTMVHQRVQSIERRSQSRGRHPDLELTTLTEPLPQLQRPVGEVGKVGKVKIAMKAVNQHFTPGSPYHGRSLGSVVMEAMRKVDTPRSSQKFDAEVFKTGEDSH